jgi:hypothetical protein
MDNIYQVDIRGMDDNALESFGDVYVHDLIRIIQNQDPITEDDEIMHNAVGMLISLYFYKINTGKIKTDRILH